MKPLQTNTSASARMALKERYTVDDILLELEMGAEFGSESEDDFEGYLEEEMEENSSGEETPLEEESCMELGEEAEEKEGMKEVSQVPIYNQQPGVTADSSGVETPLEEESCMEVGEEAKEKEGMEEAAHVPVYSQQPGVTADIAEGRPIDFFKLFITSTMLQHIVSSTKLFADQYHESHDLPPRSRVREWRKTPHTLAELQKFIALVLTMSIVHFPKMENHWSTYWPYATNAFSSVS